MARIAENSSSTQYCSQAMSGCMIIDSNAIDHMTFGSKLFSSYTSPKVHYITVVDGSHTRVIGYGDIDLQPSFTLKNVLYIPRLSNNLDLATGRTIGVTKEQGGLYFLSHKRDCHKSDSHSLPSQVWLQHKHLRHLPSLFLQQSVVSLMGKGKKFMKNKINIGIYTGGKTSRARRGNNQKLTISHKDLVRTLVRNKLLLNVLRIGNNMSLSCIVHEYCLSSFYDDHQRCSPKTTTEAYLRNHRLTSI
ncbi:hypothetical protein CR513_23255, partial [Mucuna pruriens]